MIYVHVGLPKTATCSLQDYLYNELNDNVIKYVGVNQPRGSDKEDELYNIIIDYINSQSQEELSKNFDNCKDVLSKVLTNNRLPLFLSEEMFTVDNLGITWQMKIERLGILLNDTPHKIIVTTREPVSALHSFYTEIYHGVKSEYSSLIHFCKDNNNALIYNYQTLTKELCLYFKSEDIIFFPFETLVKRGGLSEFLKKIDILFGGNKGLPVINAKKKKTDGAFTRRILMTEWIDELSISEYKKSLLRKWFSSHELPFSSKLIKKLSGKERDEIKELYKSNLY